VGGTRVIGFFFLGVGVLFANNTLPSWTLFAQSCDFPLRRFGIYRIATTQAIAKSNHNRDCFGTKA